jgi:hypothetical protein
MMEINQIFSVIQTCIVVVGCIRVCIMIKQVGKDCNTNLKCFMEINNLNEHITLRLKEEHETLKKTIYQLSQEVLYVKEKLKAVSRENAKKSVIEMGDKYE